MYLTKKYFGKLNKRQIDEIGTLKSPTKPMYLAKRQVEELNLKKEELENLLPEKDRIKEEIKNIQKEVKEEEEVLCVLQEIEKIKLESKLEEEKINVHIKAKEELEKNKSKLEESIKDIKQAKEKRNASNILYIVPALFAVISIILFVFTDELFGLIGAGITILSFAWILIKNLKQNKEYKKEQEEIRQAKKTAENKLELLEEEIKAKEKIIKEIKEGLELNIKIKKDNIEKLYPNTKIDINMVEERANVLEEQNYINNLKLKISQKELINQSIVDKLEKLTEIEEKLRLNEERLKELIEYDETINIAKEALETAYLEMKESITPKFTENLSNGINSITCGKYKKVKVNEESGLVLETENRKIHNCKPFKRRNNRPAIFVFKSI